MKPTAFLFFAAASLHALEPLPLMNTVTVNGIELSAKSPPKGFVLREELGLITANAVDGQVVHRTQTRILETRATITPKGDYLLMFPQGDHYAKSAATKAPRITGTSCTSPASISNGRVVVTRQRILRLAGELASRAITTFAVQNVILASLCEP